MSLGALLGALAGLMGAAGVALLAAGAHGAEGARLTTAGTFLLFHAAAVIALRALDPAPEGLALAATAGLVAGPVLFAGDLVMRATLGHGLFPMAAPTGGFLTIAAWLATAVLLALAG